MGGGEEGVWGGVRRIEGRGAVWGGGGIRVNIVHLCIKVPWLSLLS